MQRRPQVQGLDLDEPATVRTHLDLLPTRAIRRRILEATRPLSAIVESRRPASPRGARHRPPLDRTRTLRTVADNPSTTFFGVALVSALVGAGFGAAFVIGLGLLS